jgi:hypothetical protein
MPHTKPIFYADAVRIFCDEDVQADLNNACKKLAQSTVDLMQTFDTVATQLHTVDLHGLAAPMLPKWNSIRKVNKRPQSFISCALILTPSGLSRSRLAITYQCRFYLWPSEKLVQCCCCDQMAQLTIFTYPDLPNSVLHRDHSTHLTYSEWGIRPISRRKGPGATVVYECM